MLGESSKWCAEEPAKMEEPSVQEERSEPWSRKLTLLGGDKLGESSRSRKLTLLGESSRSFSRKLTLLGGDKLGESSRSRKLTLLGESSLRMGSLFGFGGSRKLSRKPSVDNEEQSTGVKRTGSVSAMKRSMSKKASLITLDKRAGIGSGKRLLGSVAALHIGNYIGAAGINQRLFDAWKRYVILSKVEREQQRQINEHIALSKAKHIKWEQTHGQQKKATHGVSLETGEAARIQELLRQKEEARRAAQEQLHDERKSRATQAGVRYVPWPTLDDLVEAGIITRKQMKLSDIFNGDGVCARDDALKDVAEEIVERYTRGDSNPLPPGMLWADEESYEEAAGEAPSRISLFDRAADAARMTLGALFSRGGDDADRASTRTSARASTRASKAKGGETQLFSRNSNTSSAATPASGGKLNAASIYQKANAMPFEDFRAFMATVDPIAWLEARGGDNKAQLGLSSAGQSQASLNAFVDPATTLNASSIYQMARFLSLSDFRSFTSQVHPIVWLEAQLAQCPDRWTEAADRLSTRTSRVV
jgi:hypothetical protein